MPIFVWEGTDKRGIKMKGEPPAKNANLLRAELRKQGITPTVVKAKTKPLFGGAGKRITAAGHRGLQPPDRDDDEVGRADRAARSRSSRGGQKNPRMTTWSTPFATDIESGSSLYESLSKHPVQFDELYRNLVKAGEVGGRARHRARHDRDLQGKHRER